MAANEPSRVELMIVSGLSGSGKSTALRVLEDLGYFCVDNLPDPLLSNFLRLADDHPQIDKVAVTMDIREASFYPSLTDTARRIQASDHPNSLLLLDCTNNSRVIQRFKETRRKHPLLRNGKATTLVEAIALERVWLNELAPFASTTIDTSDLSVHDLKRRIQDLFGDAESKRLAVHVMSFGFRHGVPAEADFVFDVRFVPNPYFVPELRQHTGLHEGVASYVMKQSSAQRMMKHLSSLFSEVVPLCKQEGKAGLTIAIGCTGGHHRSVAISEALAQELRHDELGVVTSHRDINR